MAIAWQKVLRDTYGYQPNCLALKNGAAHHHLLPFSEVDSWLSGKRSVTLPFLDDCPMIDEDEPAFKALFKELVAIGKQRNWKNIILKGGRPFLEDEVASTTYYGHKIRLKETEKELFSHLRSSTRRAIRKAKKSKVTIEKGTSEELLRDYYKLQCITRKRHGLPPQSYSFFQNIKKRILEPGSGQIVIAKHQGKPVAGAIFFHHDQQAFFKFGASDMRYQIVRGNNLVMWTAITHYASQGYKELNLGRTAVSNDGLRFFKLSWGAAETPLEYFCYDLEKDAFVPRPEMEAGWHNHLFSHSPIWLSRIAGKLLYKHMA